MTKGKKSANAKAQARRDKVVKARKTVTKVARTAIKAALAKAKPKPRPIKGRRKAINKAGYGVFRRMAETSTGGGRYYHTLSGSNALKGTYNTVVLPFDDPTPVPISAHQTNRIMAVRLYDVLPLDFTTDASVDNFNPKDRFLKNDGDFLVNIFKDPFRSCVFWNPNASKTFWTYELNFAGAQGITRTLNIDCTVQRCLPFTYANPVASSHTFVDEHTTGTPPTLQAGLLNFQAPSTTEPPHQSRWYAGEGVCATFNDARYFWIDCAVSSDDTIQSHKPAYIYLIHPPGVKPDAGTFELYQKKSGAAESRGPLHTSLINVTLPESITGNVNPINDCYVSWISILSRGYYTIVQTTRTTNVASISITNAFICLPNVDFMSHHCLPELELSLEFIKEMRVSASAAMVSCTAPAIQVAGSVFGYQFKSAQKPWYVTGDNIADMTVTNDFKMGSWVNGMYAFVKPKSTSEFDLRQYVALGDDTKTITDVRYPMDTDEYVQIRVTTGHSRSGIGYLTRGWVVEYTTDSKWRQNGKLSTANSAAVEKLVAVVARTQQFHDNPLHISDLVRYLKGGAKFALTHGPTLMKLFKSLAI